MEPAGVVSHAWYKGFAKPHDGWDPATGQIIPAQVATPGTNRWMLGVGWYE